MGYINKIEVGNSTHLIEPTLYGICNTNASTSTKQVEISNFTLVSGVQIAVKFNNTNTAETNELKLQINSETATPIKYHGSNLLNKNLLSNNKIHIFIYDGTNWELINSFDIVANATSTYWNFSGTNGTNAVTYSLAPYSSKQTAASFYSGNANPTLDTRLNYDGHLYCTKLYSNNTEVSVDGHTHDILNNTLRIRNSDIDFTKTNYNVPTNSSSYKYLGFSENNNTNISSIESGVNENKTYISIRVRSQIINNDTITNASLKGISITMSNGQVDYTIDNPSAFRTAIGASSLTIGTTNNTAMAGNTIVNKVKQSSSSGNANYKVLFGEDSSPTSGNDYYTCYGSLTYNPSTKALSTGTGGTINGYTLGSACEKGVTDNSSNSDVSNTDQNLITGRTLYYQLAKKGYTTNTGTVTSLTITTVAPLIGGKLDATTTAGSYEIKFADQAKNTILAGPSSGNDAAPSFRSLVDDDIPNSLTLTSISAEANANMTISTNANTENSMAVISGSTLSFRAGTKSTNIEHYSASICFYQGNQTYNKYKETARFDPQRNFVPGPGITNTIGTSDKRWSNIYATTFTGNLDGNIKVSEATISSTDTTKYLVFSSAVNTSTQNLQNSSRLYLNENTNDGITLNVGRTNTNSNVKGSIKLHDGNSSDTGHSGTIQISTLKGNRTYTLPDTTGTFAIIEYESNKPYLRLYPTGTNIEESYIELYKTNSVDSNNKPIYTKHAVIKGDIQNGTKKYYCLSFYNYGNTNKRERFSLPWTVEDLSDNSNYTILTTKNVVTVEQGGTGASTLTSGTALIGNGTGAIQTRLITDNTTPSTITANTNLVTANTIANWKGSSNIVTVGTITSGAWNGTAIAIANGGTGLTSSPSMKVNLGSTDAANILQASPRPGVTGILSVGNGGTGASSFTANQVIMSGNTSTAAFTTRAITDITEVGTVTASTNLITANTLVNWTGSSNIITIGTLTSNLIVQKSSPQIKIGINSTSGDIFGLTINGSNNRQGLYSWKYYNGSNYVTTAKYLICRNNLGNTLINVTSNSTDGETSNTASNNAAAVFSGNGDDSIITFNGTTDISVQTSNNTTTFTNGAVIFKGGLRVEKQISGSKVYNAVWNDYAECRQVITEEPGYCVTETTSGTMIKTYARLQPGCKITSDTFGTCMGYTNTAKTPIAVAGRVLVHPYRDRTEYPLGAAVCSAPNGTVDIMTREEIMTYPERIVGTVSEIPDYEIWKGGNQDGNNDILVNGRIWIYVR